MRQDKIKRLLTKPIEITFVIWMKLLKLILYSMTTFMSILVSQSSYKAMRLTKKILKIGKALEIDAHTLSLSLSAESLKCLNDDWSRLVHGIYQKLQFSLRWVENVNLFSAS